MWTSPSWGRQACPEPAQHRAGEIQRDWREEQEEWYGEIAEWQRGHPLRYQQPPDGAILPQYAIDQIYRVTEDARSHRGDGGRAAPDVGGAVLPSCAVPGDG